MILSGDFPDRPPRPLRQITISGQPRWRCDECGCGVSADHVPGSTDCEEARRERIESQSDWED